MSDRSETAYSLTSWAEYLRFHAVLIGRSDAADIPTMQRLYSVCVDVGLPMSVADDVFAGFSGYDAAQLLGSINVLRESDLRFTLLADCYEMARRARFADPPRERSLRRLAEALGISEAQQDAIALYIKACDHEHESPWRDPINEMNLALHHVAQVGGSPTAVTETRSIALRRGVGYLALVRLCSELLR